ncbi:hypothetical protein [Clostridium sp. MD294]|uniref:hypothetical protein n=1 Tax=Clostridium sp. MD294 TaxID=97138 RepID=UPI0002C9CE54|nr:hypothetical protein [Clostridium sp. MD294]NDO45340.1 hypothetical protein [Clostridium sp. MD294]USF31019.1 hypothetical protein C820_002465 [Clostridium sp. MD294]
MQNSITPRYSYIISANLDFCISSSGAKYSIYIYGNEITKISGTLTASGRGSYELIFSGSVSTKNGSEPITISETYFY